LTKKKNEQITFAKFGKAFQEKLAYNILEDRPFANQMIEVLEVNYLELRYIRTFVELIFDYKKKYEVHPTQVIVSSIIRSELDEASDIIKKQMIDFLARIKTGDVNAEDGEYVREKSLDFCKKQKLKDAILKSVELLQTSSFEEIQGVIEQAMKLGLDNNYGHDFIEDFEDRYTIHDRDPISTGWDEIDDITRGGLGKKELGIIVAPTGCHERGTLVMMSDGKRVAVEDIRKGDELMGPDSLPRTVKTLARGRDRMYRITPVKGESFVVNGGHILSLVRTADGTSFAGKVVNLTVDEYLTKSKTFRHIHKLYRTGVKSFASQSKVSHPYFVGLMLGDGSTSNYNIRFTSDDEVLREEVCRVADIFGLTIREYQKQTGSTIDLALVSPGQPRNPLGTFLREIGIYGQKSDNKRVPSGYLVAPEADRLSVLAGLIDTDGSCSKGYGYDFVSKSQGLADDVAFLSRSLGLAAYVTECTKSDQHGTKGQYYRVSISGDCIKIPVRIERKKCSERQQKKNVLRTGFSVEQVPDDYYYGFELTGDHLYLMGDFTVTHNSGKSMAMVHLGTQALKEGKTVVHYTLELADTVVGNRYDSCLTKVQLQDLHSMKDKIEEEVRGVTGKLIVKEYPTKSASTSTIENHLDRLRQRGIEPDMIIIDYGDLLRPRQQGGYKTELRHNLGDIYEEMRGIAQKYEAVCWSCSQTNRSGLNAEVITMESISEAFNKCFVADLICSISRTVEDKAQDKGRMFVAKNRNGPDGIVYPMTIDTSRVRLEVHHPDSEAGGIDSVVAKTKQEQQDWLKKKYKTYNDESVPGNRRRKKSKAPEHRSLSDLLANGPQTKEELDALPAWEKKKFIRDLKRQKENLAKEQAAHAANSAATEKHNKKENQ